MPAHPPAPAPTGPSPRTTTGATTSLALRGVTKSYDHRVVLDGLTASITPGVVTGVIGENGCGKSTLLRLLAGAEEPDSGRVVAVAAAGLAHLPQESGAPPSWTVGRVVDEALADVRRLARRARELEEAMSRCGPAELDALLAEYGEVSTAFGLRDGWSADARVERAFAGLGLAGLDRSRTLGRLSGGQRSRLHLAALLAADAEVLLLDEPTNHLDDTAAGWLEQHLRSRRGTTVVVSHDREFLDRTAAELLEVDGGRATRHPGGYDGYLATRAAERARAEQERAAWEEEVQRLRTTGDAAARRVAPNRPPRDGAKMQYDFKGGRVQESLAARVRANAERLRRLEAAEVPRPPDPLRFTVPQGLHARAGAHLVAEGVSVAGRLAPTDVRVERDTRLLVTGVNGSGKSTLLDVLAGALEPDTGVVRRRARAGLLRQDPPAPVPGQDVLRAFAGGRRGGAEEHAHRLLSLGLFDREQLGVEVARLSTGGRRRLDLARLLADPHDVLLLDEPTNHLAPQLVEELEQAIAAFDGAVVVVSHDRRFRARWRSDVLRLGPVQGGPAPG
ncbi:ABC-F family ATP-binding cassette domain-containing protein [Kineococcus sp. SYSU DK018]|uniref:ABC-F family ATP-binding cassette domain-containing protein n=1 Tax=Kineococcus sp. SYSU DK018 TaxID=3383139 RepID=UPI003D7E798E